MKIVKFLSSFFTFLDPPGGVGGGQATPCQSQEAKSILYDVSLPEISDIYSTCLYLLMLTTSSFPHTFSIELARVRESGKKDATFTRPLSCRPK
jgi:hypothetical protein